ncbi:MAG: hypothetical protein OEV94_08615 [Deltaproteobacteria bacterium]|nr:hypothetical protein [Deltaproteobacteria bacterium]
MAAHRRFKAAGMLFAAALVWASPLWSAEEYPADPQHRGIVAMETYQVFPENRPGNGVYLGNQLLLALPGKTIVAVTALPVEGRFVYLARNDQDKWEVGAHMAPGDSAPVITIVAPGYYTLTATMDGVVVKKVYRRVNTPALVDLLPYAKTADGVTAGAEGVVFFHVGKDEPGAPTGTDQRFPLKLHLSLFNEGRVRHLPSPVYNGLPTAPIAWKDEKTFTLKRSNGQVLTVNTSQFR